MIDQRVPKFEWGQTVTAVEDLYNDGSHPEAPEDALLVVAGGPGEIVQVGHHAEAEVREAATERLVALQNEGEPVHG